VTERGQVRYGNSTIEYEVVRSTRRKKSVGLTVDGQVGLLVAAPIDVSPDHIGAIVRRRAPWVLRKATPAMLLAHPREFVSGESVLYLGRRVRLTVATAQVRRPQIRFRHWSFEVQVPRGLAGDSRRDAIRSAFVRWYKARALDRLRAAVQRWAAVLGQSPAEILIRDQRQRWASCAPDGTLRFNWRVVLAEPAIVDYVVAHELVHLAVKKHSAAFWTRLAAVIPDYMQRRRRLRELGPYLSL
jgi:predicted metal-dependent hydrolase